MGSGAGAAAGAGAGGGACSYCGSSCWDQRFACRRETRFETAVAVPATTATRAAPRSNGISDSFLRVCGFEGLGMLHEVGAGDASPRYELRAARLHGRGEGPGPAV